MYVVYCFKIYILLVLNMFYLLYLNVNIEYVLLCIFIIWNNLFIFDINKVNERIYIGLVYINNFLKIICIV